MTPHQIELVKKLDQEVQNLSILMQHTEVGDSLTLKDIRHYLYLLNKETKSNFYLSFDCILMQGEPTVQGKKIQLGENKIPIDYTPCDDMDQILRYFDQPMDIKIDNLCILEILREDNEPQPKGLKLE